MDIPNKATRIDLFTLRTRPMRAFHMTWFAFFLCFFAWFGIAPLMPIVKEELGLSKEQIGNTIIASVAITILARLLIGWLCDRIGPRRSYTVLLIAGSLPVMGIGLAHGYESFLLFRLGIGVIGASFVITQYHTSVMFAPNCVGAANATTAGWGNLGGGVTQMIMPLVFAGFVGLGYGDALSWRLSMVTAGAVCLLAGIAYYFFTTDLPNGDFKQLQRKAADGAAAKEKGLVWKVAKDRRVWALFVVYATCFGIELTINNIAAIYYREQFGLGLKAAGLVAGLFGLMNIFARTLGGFISDRFVVKGGLGGRVKWLYIATFMEGIALILFSQTDLLVLAIPMMVVFSLFVQMSEGATYAVVPFINKKALGVVAGIVGAGGNMGAVAAGFLFRSEQLSYQTALFILGVAVAVSSHAVWLVRFRPEEEAAAGREHADAVASRAADDARRPVRRSLAPAIQSAVKHVRPMDCLRVYMGIALTIKGIYFITDFAAVERALSSPLPEWQTFVAWCVVFAHVVGGSMLALGYVSRVAAGINAIVMAGAVGVHLFGDQKLGGVLTTNVDFQFTFFIFFALVLLVWRGSGPLSLDRVLSGRAAVA